MKEGQMSVPEGGGDVNKGWGGAAKGPSAGRLPASPTRVEVCAEGEDTDYPFSAWKFFLFLVPSPLSQS